MKKGHVFFIAGVVASGKGTMTKLLIEDKKLNLKFVPSIKTRKPRKDEINGVDLISISFEEFRQEIERGDFFEYNFVHNQNYYGTRNKDIFDNGINKGLNLILEIDILILPTILKEGKLSKEDFTFIFIDIPIDIIRERMILRGDKVDGLDYKNRVNSAIEEKKLLYLADYVIDGTQKKEKVFEEIKNIIIKKISNK